MSINILIKAERQKNISKKSKNILTSKKIYVKMTVVARTYAGVAQWQSS